MASPGFEVSSVQRVKEVYILGMNSLDSFKHPFILANTPNGNTKPIIEGTVTNGDIGRIGLRTDTIISVIHNPVIEGNMGTVDGIGTIGVFCR